MSAQVIVIGAGYGGLTSAAILAHNGIEVEVFEATGHLGGRASFDIKDGFTVDYGIHANRFGEQGAAASALREINYEIEFVKMGEPLLFHGDSFVKLPTTPIDFIKTKIISASEKVLLIGNMVKLVGKKYEALVDTSLESVLAGRKRKAVPEIFSILSGLCLVSPDISKTSAGEMAQFLKRAMRAKENVAYPKGGTKQIIDALASKIKENGQILTNRRVKAIEIKNGKVKSVLVKGEKHEAEAVIFAVPLQKIGDFVEEGLPDEFIKKCSSIVPTAGISIDLCLSDRVSDIDGLVITSNPLTMGQFTSNIDPEVAPEGKQLATFYYPLPVELMDDRESVEKQEAFFTDLIERLFPGITEKTEWRRVLVLKMVDGFEPRVGQSARYRPGVRAPGVENLFFAGDVVSAPGSGGDVAFASGVEAARQVISYLK